ncbi:MAG: hypothetical protein Phyf2KO_08290 [Phycisphaerales bacterium]
MPDDPFLLLGLAPSFDLTEREIERAYLERVALNHPDLVSDDDDAAARAAALNDARAALLDPESRARILLTTIVGEQSDDSLPDGFLFEIMEVRSELDNAAAAGDAEQIKEWQSWADARRAEYIEKIRTQFSQLSEPPEDQETRAIRTTLNAWRYIERMIEQAGLVGR